MRTLAMLMLPVAAACGRMGFDGAPALLVCGAPARFAVGATTSKLAATATPRGYSVFAVDDIGDVHGFTYEFEAGTLGQKVSDVPVASNAYGPLGALALGDQLLLAMPYGRPDPTGTALIPLDAQLAARTGPAMGDGWFGSISSLAPASSGTVAFLFQLGSGEVDAKLVSPLGGDVGAAHPVIDAADGVTHPTIVPVGSSFLVVWGANAPSPNEVRAKIVDQQFIGSPLPTKISSETQIGSYIPRAGHMAAADTYVFAWMEKVTGGDQIWISLRDGQLQETQHVMIGSGSNPAVVAGDNDFLVVWENGPTLDAARITADGKITPVSILGSGGALAAWDLAVANGQPAVVWVETGGTGPNLWIDPLCN